MALVQTTERLMHKDVVNNFLYKRSIFAYYMAAEYVQSHHNVLEIGTGSGYGIELIANKSNYFTTIDKFEALDLPQKENVLFIQMNVPPLKELKDGTYDIVVAFQLIEHIEDDVLLVDEIYRVLKPGGMFVVTTPNKKMSLTRNPWHVREYFIDELYDLLNKRFKTVQKKGVFAKGNAAVYYDQNRISVKKITRYDIFNFQYVLPRRLLQIPYDIMNILNRNLLHRQNSALVESVSLEDFFLEDAKDDCLDLFFIATK